MFSVCFQKDHHIIVLLLLSAGTRFCLLWLHRHTRSTYYAEDLFCLNLTNTKKTQVLSVFFILLK